MKAVPDATDSRRSARGAGALLLFTALLAVPAQSQNCGTTALSGYLNFLKQSPDNWVTAYVVSNSAGNVVTYAEIPLKAGTGFVANWLVSAKSGTQYFNNKHWVEPDCQGLNCPEYPFSPYKTKTMAVSANPATGTLYISWSDGPSHSFTPLFCGFRVIMGQQSSFLSTTGYVISFRQGTNPPPPK